MINLDMYISVRRIAFGFRPARFVILISSGPDVLLENTLSSLDGV
jgi:hypothetical protein